MNSQLSGKNHSKKKKKRLINSFINYNRSLHKIKRFKNIENFVTIKNIRVFINFFISWISSQNIKKS